MKITNVSIIPFQQKFKHPLKTANQVISHCDGFIIKIESGNFVGYGESSQLPGFSIESLKEVSYALESYRLALVDLGETSVDELCSFISIHCDGYPSVEFGLETAIFDLASQIDGKSFSQYLNPNASQTITSNGIVDIHSSDENFSTMKVKVGFRNLFDELNHLDKLSTEFGGHVKFRLDANGSLDLPRAIRFCKEVERFNIDYVEQPLPKNELEDLAELRNHTSIHIAVDESLTDVDSGEKIIDAQAADVFIIKPTVSGGFRTCQKIMDLASSEKIRSVITSSLEGPIGLSTCAHFASALLIDEACGLSTASLFDDSISPPFSIKNGVIQLSQKSGLGVDAHVT
ncbi:MAG: o-succinylbenzoate synthase [Candidatus Marinimicrobia bacterium]|nr:o-succinylbenzoate synthase [Candidatus Neomarinimicrobiota bacterium]